MTYLTNDESYRLLANAVVLQAVYDWRRLCYRIRKNIQPETSKHQYTGNFNSLRQFFKSGYCALLCGNINPKLILDKLEKERLDALRGV